MVTIIVRTIIFTLLLLVGCQAQEEDIEKLIQKLPPLEKLTYDKNASEKIQSILQQHREEFETLRREAQDDTTGRWERWNKNYRSVLIKFFNEHINTKSALTALFSLGEWGNEMILKHIAENYKGTWQSIAATSRIGRLLPNKDKTEYFSKYIEDYIKLDKETDPEYLQWFGEGFTDSVKYYYGKKSYFGASYLYRLVRDYLSLDEVEKAEKLLWKLFNEYPDDCVEKIDVDQYLYYKKLGERKLKKEWLQGKGIKYEGFKKMESKEQERINAEWQSEFNKLPEDERERKMMMAFADWVSGFNDWSVMYGIWYNVCHKWPDTPEGKEAYKKWVALIRSSEKLEAWLKQYGLMKEKLTDDEIVQLDYMRYHEQPGNKVFGRDEATLAKDQKSVADILTKRPDWQEWLKGKGDISKAKPTDILEWRKEWSKSKAKDSNPSIK